jgi:hypothetical protein
VVTLDNIEEIPWKARIKGFIYHRTNNIISVHFAADYYRHIQSYVRIDGRGRLVDNADEAAGMNLIYTTNMILFDKESIKPLNRLQHKFMAIPTATTVRRGKAIAYEIDSRRKRNKCSLEFFRNILIK